MSKGDGKISGHDADRPFRQELDDPFADLSDLIDGADALDRPTASAERTPRPESYGAREDAIEDFESEFAEAFDKELAGELGRNSLPPRFSVGEPRANTRAPLPSAHGHVHGDGRSAEDDVDEELVSALNGLYEPANPRQASIDRSDVFAPAREDRSSPASRTHLDDFDELIASELAVMNTIVSESASAAKAGRDDVLVDGNDRSDLDEPLGSPPRHVSSADHRTAAPRGWSDEMSGDLSERTHPVPAARPGSSRGGMRLAASVALLAILGGAGAYVLGGAGELSASSGDVLIVAADTEPVKVAPKDPGGRSVPNQKQQVYERVQSASADMKPSQKTLLSAAVEPVALPEEAPVDDLPGVDMASFGSARAAEVPLAQPGTDGAAAVAEATPVLMPRRVRTLTVRPDGTLVVESQVEGAGSAAPQAAAPAMIEAGARPVGLDAAPAQTPAPPAAAASTPAEGGSGEGLAGPDETVVVASVEPSAAPAEPVAETQAADPNAFYVQISSQPSEEAARTSSRTLGSRYAGVIGGRNLVIQSADIPGKGTYYRVRVATGSRDEANTLCTDLKSAGGSCFVSR